MGGYATYEAIAELLGGRSEEIALFDNATHAWNAAFYSIPLQPGGREVGQADVAGLDEQFDLGAPGDDALGTLLAKPADHLQVPFA